jgi:hypothetical protein
MSKRDKASDTIPALPCIRQAVLEWADARGAQAPAALQLGVYIARLFGYQVQVVAAFFAISPNRVESLRTKRALITGDEWAREVREVVQAAKDKTDELRGW